MFSIYIGSKMLQFTLEWKLLLPSCCFWWLNCKNPLPNQFLAIVISVLCPLYSFTTTKGWKVLSNFWFCCCFVDRCFHGFKF